jgi:hypothetical protein
MKDRNENTLSIVREIGFDQKMGLGRPFEEKIFFLGPSMHDDREVGAHATEEAVLEFIGYWENQVRVARDYLANGLNNKTHEWIRQGDR